MSQTGYGREKTAPFNEIDWYEHGHVGGVEAGQAYKSVQETAELVKVDEPDASTTYVGQAKPGTAESSAGWRIKKITVSGSVTTIAYADGDILYNNVWTDRATLTYS